MLACPIPGPLPEAAGVLGVRVFPLKLCQLRRNLSWDAWVTFLSRWVGVTLRLVRIILAERVDIVHLGRIKAILAAIPDECDVPHAIIVMEDAMVALMLGWWFASRKPSA